MPSLYCPGDPPASWGSLWNFIKSINAKLYRTVDKKSPANATKAQKLVTESNAHRFADHLPKTRPEVGITGVKTFKVALPKDWICLDLEDASEGSLDFLQLLVSNGIPVDISPKGAHVFVKRTQAQLDRHNVPQIALNLLGGQAELKREITIWHPVGTWDGGSEALQRFAVSLLAPRIPARGSQLSFAKPPADGTRHASLKFLLAEVPPKYAREVAEYARGVLFPGWQPQDYESLVSFFENRRTDRQAPLSDEDAKGLVYGSFAFPEAYEGLGVVARDFVIENFSVKGRLPFPCELNNYLREHPRRGYLYGRSEKVDFLTALYYWSTSQDLLYYQDRWYRWVGTHYALQEDATRRKAIYAFCDEISRTLGPQVRLLNLVARKAKEELAKMEGSQREAKSDRDTSEEDKALRKQNRETARTQRSWSPDGFDQRIFAQEIIDTVSGANSRQNLLLQLVARGAELSAERLAGIKKDYRAMAFINGCLYLNEANGDFFFETMHSREYLVTFCAQVTYDPAKKRGRTFWDFLYNLGGKTPKGVAALWKMAFLACFPHKENQCALRFMHGPSGVGKGLFVELLFALLGGQNGAMWSTRATNLKDTFELHNYAGRNAVAIAEINLMETPQTTWDTYAALSGRDTLSARNLYQQGYKFQYEGILIFSTNKDPIYLTKTESLARRLHLIEPSPVDTPDPRLKRQLRLELPGFVNWMLEVNRSAKGQGIELLDRMGDGRLLNERSNRDPLLSFIQDRLVLDSSARTSFSDLQTAYENYRVNLGRAKPEFKGFGRILKAKLKQEYGETGLKQVKNSDGNREYSGLALRKDNDDRKALVPRRDEVSHQVLLGNSFSKVMLNQALDTSLNVVVPVSEPSKPPRLGKSSVSSVSSVNADSTGSQTSLEALRSLGYGSKSSVSSVNTSSNPADPYFESKSLDLNVIKGLQDPSGVEKEHQSEGNDELVTFTKRITMEEGLMVERWVRNEPSFESPKRPFKEVGPSEGPKSPSPKNEGTEDTEDTEDFSRVDPVAELKFSTTTTKKGSSKAVKTPKELSPVPFERSRVNAISVRNFPRVAKQKGRRSKTDPSYPCFFEDTARLQRERFVGKARVLELRKGVDNSVQFSQALEKLAKSLPWKDPETLVPWLGRIREPYESSYEAEDIRNVFSTVLDANPARKDLLRSRNDTFAYVRTQAFLYTYRYESPRWMESKRIFERPFAVRWWLEERSHWKDAYARRTARPSKTYIYATVVIRANRHLFWEKRNTGLSLETLDMKACHRQIAAAILGPKSERWRRLDKVDNENVDIWNYLRSMVSDEDFDKVGGKPVRKALLYKGMQGGSYTNVSKICENLGLKKSEEEQQERVQILGRVGVFKELATLSGALDNLEYFWTPECPESIVNISRYPNAEDMRKEQLVSRLLTGAESVRQATLINMALKGGYGLPVSLEHDGITFLVANNAQRSQRREQRQQRFKDWSKNWLGRTVALEWKQTKPVEVPEEGLELLFDEAFISERTGRRFPLSFDQADAEELASFPRKVAERRKKRDLVNEKGRDN